MNIYFTANLKGQTFVQCRTKDGKYKKCPVSIIEFDKNKLQDIETLEDLSTKWSTSENTIPSCIYNEATKDTSFSLLPNDQEHFFGITLQKKGLKKIKPKDVLSLSVFTESEMYGNELNWLVVNPATRYKVGENRRFKQVGKAMVKHIIANYNQNPISVISARDAVKFYRKLGFKSYERKIPEAMIYKFSIKI